MSSFFIKSSANKDNGGIKRKANGVSKQKSKKPKVYYSNKKDKKSFLPTAKELEDEEIPSEDEEIDFNDHVKEPEEDTLTPQDTKVKLAHQYLSEIEKQLQEKLDNDKLLNESVFDKLKEDVLDKEGKLKKTFLSDFNTDICEQNIKVLRCKEHQQSVTVVTLSANSKFIFSGSKDGSIVKWTIDGNKVKKLLPKQKDKNNIHLNSSILSLAVSSDDKFLASSDEGTSLIQIWHTDSLEHYFTLKHHRSPVTGLSFCKVTHNLYSCSRDRTVNVWNVQDKTFIETLYGHSEPITGVDVLCKGRVVTSGGTDGTCRVWKIEEETHLVYNAGSRNVESVKRLDGNHFVSCNQDGSISLWGNLKKKPLAVVKSAHSFDPINNEPLWITSLACIPNSEVFVSGSSDGFVRFWNCTPNYCQFSQFFSLPVKGFINSMVFSEDRDYLVIGVGQEHKLGRWSKVKEAKNSVVIVKNLITKNALKL